MSFQNVVVGIYPSIVKRIYSWVLPVDIFLLYFSAYALRTDSLLGLFSRIGISTIHIYCGIVLIIVLVTLLYDSLYGFSARSMVRFSEQEKSRKPILSQLKFDTYRRVVDCVFYTFLSLFCCFGLLIYSMKFSSWTPPFPDITDIIIVHESMGWLFLSVVLVKYYLTITEWIQESVRYLREY
ncbi:MAG: hypothetical protein GY866_22640 [Proteobacteria bacterium]|nr:hypothetical protein [Pseudomonadota bacterium]